jgi:hypothetical protein
VCADLDPPERDALSRLVADITPRARRTAQRPVSPRSDSATMTSASVPAKTKKKTA